MYVHLQALSVFKLPVGTSKRQGMFRFPRLISGHDFLLLNDVSLQVLNRLGQVAETDLGAFKVTRIVRRSDVLTRVLGPESCSARLAQSQCISLIVELVQ